MSTNIMVINFFYVWTILNVIAILLVSLRKDSKKIYQEFALAFKGGILSNVLAFFILFSILPFTIYYSIKNFLNK